MSGHSKWATIKHKKGKLDAQRGASFAKVSRDIMVAVKEGGADPAGNFRLKTAIEKAKEAGFPSDNIKRALEKGSGGGADSNIEDITYEGYGPGGVAIIIEAMTDNRNRTAGDIRSYFNKNNGNLGETGCVGWMFKAQGVISVEKNDLNPDELFDVAINSGAEDFLTDDEEDFKIITTPETMQAVAEEIQKLGYKIKSAEKTKTPENTVPVQDDETAKYLLRLLGSAEDHDDVQNVYANFEMSDELLEKFS